MSDDDDERGANYGLTNWSSRSISNFSLSPSRQAYFDQGGGTFGESRMDDRIVI